MSFYVTAPGVPRAVIHPYPKRRRASYIEPAHLHTEEQLVTVDGSVVPMNACYADFFRPDEPVEQAS